MRLTPYVMEKTAIHNGLHLSLLGPPEVTNAGEIMHFSSSRKALALLIYLVVEGQVQSRQRLAELLWPESDAIHARAALRITLLELRKILEVMEHPPLLIDRNTLSINVQAEVTSDLQAVQTSLHILKTLANNPLAATEELRIQLLTHLHTAVKHYRGSFLDNFSLRDSAAFDDWVRYQRDYWHQSMHMVFEHLAQLHERAGELKQAIEIVSRWLILDPFNEDACQQLMSLQAATGNRIAALQTFDHYRLLLIDEIGAEPSSATIALKERIRTSAPAEQPAKKVPQIRAFSRLLPPFVGRAPEYNTLVESFNRARSGMPQVITLEGVAGSGKTRLVTEFLQWCSVQDTVILQGSAFEGSALLPFQPLIDALRLRVEQENAPDDLLADVWLAELSRLLPELRERYPDLVLPYNEDAIIRTQIFEAVARLCNALAQNRVLILFLDDLHWAHHNLLGGIYYLIQRWQQSCSPILVILSFRPDQENPPAPSLTDWNKKLRRLMPSVVHFPLSPFEPSDILYLLQSLTANIHAKTLIPFMTQFSTNADLLTILAGQLYELTNGHIFYTIETINCLIENKAFSSLQNVQHTHERMKELLRNMLPNSIQEHILLSFKQVTSAAQAFCIAITILGPDATFDQLCRTANLTENEALSALDELQCIGFLRKSARQDEQPYRYLFTYSKTSDILKTTVSQARYQMMVRRAKSTTNVPLAKVFP
ncbi:AAA family ATPase [Dictyobacter arantiisoli]|uniref:Bacterial transcriptional activator domain-containing protein n=1 Tax=Dictyobacter arantiisoli TaxID=2014874 RepID=A0A5A5T731_9CHLR|nr:AAA family ATPase [Dictyobacter arantiisoli]GCF07280.1 hypothetical protein KDI_08440 [Dictyobacter arantiisoli]